jgi:hypothetical protein
VDQHREEHGLNRCLEAIDLPKSTYYYRKNRSTEPSEEEQELMDHVHEIIGEHPSYGYRRILPELEERTGLRVNHKRLRRLLSEHELGLSRQALGHSPSPVQEILGDAAGNLNLVAGKMVELNIVKDPPTKQSDRRSKKPAQAPSKPAMGDSAGAGCKLRGEDGRYALCLQAPT